MNQIYKIQLSIMLNIEAWGIKTYKEDISSKCLGSIHSKRQIYMGVGQMKNQEESTYLKRGCCFLWSSHIFFEYTEFGYLLDAFFFSFEAKRTFTPNTTCTRPRKVVGLELSPYALECTIFFEDSFVFFTLFWGPGIRGVIRSGDMSTYIIRDSITIEIVPQILVLYGRYGIKILFSARDIDFL